MLLESYLKEKGINKAKLENYIRRNIEKNVKAVLEKIKRIIAKIENYKIDKWIPLLNWITSQYTSGFFRELKKKNAWELLFALLIVKSVSEKNYPASIIYTAQTREKGRGYYLGLEEPTEEELIEEFLKHLNSFYRIQWYGLNEGYLYEIIVHGKIKEHLQKIIEESPMDSKYGFSFEKVAVYNPDIISKRRGKETLVVKYPNIVLFIIVDYLLNEMFRENKQPSYEDFAEIYVVSNRLVHRRHFIFPNIFEIYNLFYKNKEDFEIKEEIVGLKGEKREVFYGSKLSKFIFSLWIKHPDYSEECLSLLDKLIYYLFNYCKINGEILDRLIKLVVTYSRKERPLRIKYLSYILNKFWNIDNMKPWMIEKWAEEIGRIILSEDYKNRHNLDEQRAKKIIGRIIDELKVENIPGRFFEKLIRILRDYELPVEVKIKKNNKEIKVDITKVIKDEKVKNNMDNFFYIKALILSGLLKSL